MSFFSRLFKKKKNDTTQIERPQECLEYIGLKAFMDSFIQGDHYVAKSEYRSRLFDYKKTVEFFGVLKSSGTLKVYCKENGLSDLEVLQTLSRYESFESIIDSQNERFVRFKMDSEKKNGDTDETNHNKQYPQVYSRQRLGSVPYACESGKIDIDRGKRTA